MSEDGKESSSDVDIASLKQQRSTHKRHITNLKGKIEKGGGKADPSVLQCQLQLLDEYYAQISSIQSKIEKIDVSDNQRDVIEDTYIAAKSKILQYLSKHRPVIADTSTLNSSNWQHASRLPKIKLPRFSGSYMEYSRFIHTFETLVDDDATLTNIDKFNYLLDCLSGPALALVEMFQVNDQNYAVALQRLKARFDNKALIFNENFKALFALQNMDKDDPVSLRALLDKISSIKSSLTTIGSEADIVNAFFIHVTVSKLDVDSVEAYAAKQDFAELPSFDKCYETLSHRCQLLESKAKGCHPTDNAGTKAKQKEGKSSKSFLATKGTCVFCQSTEHSISRCSNFKALSHAKRCDFSKRNSLCFNCLSKGHNISKCTSKYRCRECKEQHHTLLHASSGSSSLAATQSPQLQTNAGNQSSNLNVNSEAFAPLQHTTLLARTTHRALLPTAVVLIKDSCGNFQPIRALLDSCSEINLITEEAAKRLELSQIRIPHIVSGIDDTKTHIKFEVEATIRSRFSRFQRTAHFAATRSISNVQPSIRVNTLHWKLPHNIELADPLFYKPLRVDLLISSEIFFDLLLDGKINLGENNPTLIKTALGWIVGGQFQNSVQTGIHNAKCHLISADTITNDILRKFWEIEEYIQPVQSLSIEEQACEDHFVQNTTFAPDGRVQVRLPFKNFNGLLGDSYQVAQRRFYSVERRLERDSTLKQHYTEFMNEYESLGHMSLVSKLHLPKETYFIPHHPVWQLNSTTTKLRVVFDASAKTTENLSLNDFLMVGPTIQQDIVTTLLSFRLNRYALTADIRKMYRQFWVHQDDRKYQCILWRSDATHPLQCYELKTITYGTSAAPFLAIRCLHFIADAYQHLYPKGAAVLKRDFYVDDVLTGANTETSLLELKHELTQLLATAQLELAKWSSNCTKMVESGTKDISVDLANDIRKALGMSWDPKQDVFRYDISSIMLNVEPTKRNILSITAKIFDLLGLLSPIIIRCKILIQEMWIVRLNWDEPLPHGLLQLWDDIRNDLPNINHIVVPRYVFTSPGYRCEIHGFSDASERAYGCCLYVRRVENGIHATTLLIAKSKVAPVKAQSLPRLELCAALLLARTWMKFKQKLLNTVDRVWFWTDSKTVLLWLQTHASTLTAFVANRVSEIQTITENIVWRHCPSKSNPADIVSRGCSAQELAATMWFSGPEFLHLDQSKWPNEILDIALPANEKRKSYSLKCTIEPMTDIVSSVVDNNSSYLRILHIIIYIHRIFNTVKPDQELRHSRNFVPISTFELNDAFYFIVALIQQNCFAAEMSKLEKGIPLAPSLQRLAPFLKTKRIFNKDILLLHVGGRLAKSSLPIEAKFPVLLPKNHRFVRLYAEYVHRRHMHAGTKVLIGLIRQRLWILNVKEIAGKVVRHCIHCFKYRQKLAQQIMADLPSDRFRHMQPFLITGVDFCGPLKTSYRIRSKVAYKTYVAIFVCFASKAVHIELVSDLSADSFIGCLKRFIARRGIPQRIYCDNATNFAGASKKLHDFYEKFLSRARQTELFNHCATTGFEFRFIPPRSPHFGGLWEAAVKSAKQLLVKHVAEANLSYEELLTVTTEVEAILNSRPLAARSDDPNDGVPLTPAHLVTVFDLLAVPEPLYDPASSSYLTRWQRITYIKQQFWRQWVRDYVLSLQTRSKWLTKHANVRVGQIVLIHDDNLPPQQWVIARIANVIPGADGRIRVVDLKTNKGVLRRSIHRIAPLPIES